MSSSKEQGEGHITAGRAAVVVPNGTLFGDGICARIKEELLKDFNLHTIVRLPNGVFAPYTSIPTNLLFFDRSHPTEEVWYYEQPLPEGRKNYTKTQPIQFEEFAGCLAWWQGREENERAWKVSTTDLLANGCNLDRKNPNAATDLEHLPPEQLADDILKKEQRILEIMVEVKAQLIKALTSGRQFNREQVQKRIRELLNEYDRKSIIAYLKEQNLYEDELSPLLDKID